MSAEVAQWVRAESTSLLPQPHFGLQAASKHASIAVELGWPKLFQQQQLVLLDNSRAAGLATPS